jgi:hypothetical protein
MITVKITSREARMLERLLTTHEEMITGVLNSPGMKLELHNKRGDYIYTRSTIVGVLAKIGNVNKIDGEMRA